MSRRGLGTCEVCRLSKSSWDACFTCHRTVCAQCVVAIKVYSEHAWPDVLCKDCIGKVMTLKHRIILMLDWIDDRIIGHRFYFICQWIGCHPWWPADNWKEVEDESTST